MFGVSKLTVAAMALSTRRNVAAPVLIPGAHEFIHNTRTDFALSRVRKKTNSTAGLKKTNALSV